MSTDLPHLETLCQIKLKTEKWSYNKRNEFLESKLLIHLESLENLEKAFICNLIAAKENSLLV